MQKGARAIILRDGKILLGKRLKKDSFYGQWCTFGGISEIGEAPEETLRRELSEELGIDIINPKLITIVEDELPEVKGKLQQYFYLIEHWNGEIGNRREHSEIRWFFPGELQNLKLGRVAKRVIQNNLKDFLT
jgi:8-oxo-dGTP diphosphatase